MPGAIGAVESGVGAARAKGSRGRTAFLKFMVFDFVMLGGGQLNSSLLTNGFWFR